jgi:hypothetical protein
LLKRHFWEGVTVIERMSMMEGVPPRKLPHYRFHGREICMAVARLVLPRYASTYSDSVPAIRMMALGRISYSLGVLYGMHTLSAESFETVQCGSA